MITMRPGSHMHNLLRLLSVSGEFPCRSLGILGNVRTVKAMVHKMEAAQNIRLSDGAALSAKLFQVSGIRDLRTVRIYKGALDVLRDIHPDALGSYLAAFPGNKFTGDKTHIRRNHRIAEATAMCMMAGMETAPYALPKLQKEAIRITVPEKPCYYAARCIKKIFEAELNKTSFTRVVGLLCYPGGTYSVYNTRDAVMKWSGFGELKSRQELSEIVRMNAGLDEVSSAILFGNDISVALQTLIESDKSQKRQTRFDRIYQSIHYVPLNPSGINLIRLLTLPDWDGKLLNILFRPDMRPDGYGPIEYDAYRDGVYILSHLDSDIARLARLKEALECQHLSVEVLCFPWQVGFVRDYLGSAVSLKQLEMNHVLNALGI